MFKRLKGVLDLSSKELTSLPDNINLKWVKELDVSNNLLLKISDELLEEVFKRDIMIDVLANLIPQEGICFFPSDKYAIMGYKVIDINQATSNDIDYINYERLQNLGIIITRKEFNDKKNDWIKIINAYPKHQLIMNHLYDKDLVIRQAYDRISSYKLKDLEIIL